MIRQVDLVEGCYNGGPYWFLCRCNYCLQHYDLESCVLMTILGFIILAACIFVWAFTDDEDFDYSVHKYLQEGWSCNDNV